MQNDTLLACNVSLLLMQLHLHSKNKFVTFVLYQTTTQSLYLSIIKRKKIFAIGYKHYPSREDEKEMNAH